jgi:hypothetical protein
LKSRKNLFLRLATCSSHKFEKMPMSSM